MLVIFSVRDCSHDLSDVEIDILSSCDELEHGEEEEDEEREWLSYKVSISLLVAEIGELKRFAMEKECEKDAAIAELREEVRTLKQEATRPYDRTPCDCSTGAPCVLRRACRTIIIHVIRSFTQIVRCFYTYRSTKSSDHVLVCA